MLRAAIGSLLLVGITLFAPARAEDSVAQQPSGAASSPSILSDAVRLSPHAHISVLIPKGWLACDPDANKLLGGAASPGGFIEKICNSRPPNAGFALNFINPNLTQLMLVASGEWTHDGVSPKYFENLPPDKLKSEIDQLCDRLKNAQRVSTSSCDLSLGQVNGQSALQGRISATTPEGVPMRMNIVAVPRDGSMLLFAILDMGGNQATTQPYIDAIIGSLEID